MVSLFKSNDCAFPFALELTGHEASQNLLARLQAPASRMLTALGKQAQWPGGLAFGRSSSIFCLGNWTEANQPVLVHRNKFRIHSAT